MDWISLGLVGLILAVGGFLFFQFSREEPKETVRTVGIRGTDQKEFVRLGKPLRNLGTPSVQGIVDAAPSGEYAVVVKSLAEGSADIPVVYRDGSRGVIRVVVTDVERPGERRIDPTTTPEKRREIALSLLQEGEAAYRGDRLLLAQEKFEGAWQVIGPVPGAPEWARARERRGEVRRELRQRIDRQEQAVQLALRQENRQKMLDVVLETFRYLRPGTPEYQKWVGRAEKLGVPEAELRRRLDSMQR